MGKIILAVILALSAYGVVSCTLNDRKKAKAKEEHEAMIDRKDAQLLQSIILKKKEFQADISWVYKFGFTGEGKRGFVDLYTKDIQDAFFNGKNILILGSIKDISTLNADSYEVTVSLGSFQLEMGHFVKPKILFKSICPKNKLDDLLADFKSAYKKKISRDMAVALIGDFYNIQDYSYGESDGEKRIGKLLFTRCGEILLAPQKFGVLRKNSDIFK
jgi:hypothetical protein